jgi:hypothetical protein
MSSPFDSLLVNLNPKDWEDGFNFAARWCAYLAAPGQAEALAEMVRLSLWPACGWPAYEPFPEGFMLGVYGFTKLGEWP